MRGLFTRAGSAAVRAAMKRNPLLAFDFDGTLAPIAPSPQQARIAPGVAERLARLGQRLPVAIVTGRAVADVRARLGFAPHYIVGNHGAEDDTDPEGAAARARALEPMRALLRDHAAALADAGVAVEDKAQSIALHYRLSATPQRAVALIHQLQAMAPSPLHYFAGKCVINAMATGAPDKAHAVRALLARSGAASAVFAGDDVNDEPVFASAPPQWLTVRVGRDPSSRARFCLDDAHQVPPFLDALLAQLPPLGAD